MRSPNLSSINVFEETVVEPVYLATLWRNFPIATMKTGNISRYSEGIRLVPASRSLLRVCYYDIVDTMDRRTVPWPRDFLQDTKFQSSARLSLLQVLPS